GALVLGISLWPFDAEVIILIKRFKVSSIPEQFSEHIQALVKEWRSIPWLVLLALAIVPAVVEEFFFRGYLFNALLAVSRPRSAILGSALLFGIFHLVMGGTLAVERLVPSTLMGIALGWVRWRSGSVWPGMLLHASHNALLLSLELFPTRFAWITTTL